MTPIGYAVIAINENHTFRAHGSKVEGVRLAVASTPCRTDLDQNYS